jgi:hypothetical protein
VSPASRWGSNGDDESTTKGTVRTDPDYRAKQRAYARAYYQVLICRRMGIR